MVASRQAGGALQRELGDQRSQALLAMLTVLRNRKGATGAAIAGIMLVVALEAPIMAPYGPLAMRNDDPFAAPFASHWFGTDEFGRDLLSRMVYGSRISLAVRAISIVLATLVGVSTGLVAGFLGAGWTR